MRAELAVAHALLADPRIDLAWEASGARTGGPDFTLTYRGRPALNLEVTRWRGTPGAESHGRPLLAKLRQLPAGMANAVVLTVARSIDAPDPHTMADAWQARAAEGDDAFFTRSGLAGVRDYRRHLARLGAVVIWSEGRRAGVPARLWRNPAARIGVPDHAARAIVDALESAGWDYREE